MKTVSKSELARRLKVSPASITGYCKKGMPVLESGRVNLKACLEWHKKYIFPERSGSYAARQRKAGKETLPDVNLDGFLDTAPVVYYRYLTDMILSRRYLIPKILAACGVQDLALLHCADDFFAALLLGLLGDLEDKIYDWEGSDDIPLIKLDIESVFRDHNLVLTSEVIERADAMSDLAFSETTKAMEEASSV